MKRLIALLLAIVLVLPIGFVQANAKFSESDLYGIWHSPFSLFSLEKKEETYFWLTEGGIGHLFDGTGPSDYGVLKWEVQSEKYITIETVQTLGTCNYAVLGIDYDKDGIVLNNMLLTGVFSLLEQAIDEASQEELEVLGIGSTEDIDAIKKELNVEPFKKLSHEELLRFLMA